MLKREKVNSSGLSQNHPATAASVNVTQNEGQFATLDHSAADVTAMQNTSNIEIENQKKDEKLEEELPTLTEAKLLKEDKSKNDVRVKLEQPCCTPSRRVVILMCTMVLIVGVYIAFLIDFKKDHILCEMRMQESLKEANISYSLAYCSTDGGYCEQISDLTNEVALQNCDIDPDYENTEYLG